MNIEEFNKEHPRLSEWIIVWLTLIGLAVWIYIAARIWSSIEIFP